MTNRSKSDQPVIHPSYSPVLIIIFQTVQNRTSANITSRDSRASTSRIKNLLISKGKFQRTRTRPATFTTRMSKCHPRCSANPHEKSDVLPLACSTLITRTITVGDKRLGSDNMALANLSPLPGHGPRGRAPGTTIIGRHPATRMAIFLHQLAPSPEHLEWRPFTELARRLLSTSAAPQSLFIISRARAKQGENG